MKKERFLIVLIPLLLFSLSSIQIASAAATANQTGRFQIVISPNVRADTFLLDTWTGKIWRMIQEADVEGQPTIWKYERRIDSEEELFKWLRTQTPISNTTQ